HLVPVDVIGTSQRLRRIPVAVHGLLGQRAEAVAVGEVECAGRRSGSSGARCGCGCGRLDRGRQHGVARPLERGGGGRGAVVRRGGPAPAPRRRVTPVTDWESAPPAAAAAGARTTPGPWRWALGTVGSA